ncbi:MAG: stage II sporulation protein M, partial [Bacteroidia bacterium]
WGSIKTFYVEEIPKILYFCRKELLISFLVLVLTVGIGIFSSAQDEGFARSILGDEYVNMTLENIKKGDPMGVYKQSGQLEMFVAIAINNLKVSLIVFLFGLFASYGALVVMARNGIMLGVFIYFFYSRNLSSEFNLTVWMHGTIEILTLVIETVAGMLLGRGLVYPGTLSRLKAFSIWGKRGAMLFLSTVPFIILAAFIESFLTRHTELPDVIRLVVILLSLGLMVFYFVAYPLSKFKKAEDLDLGMPDLNPETELEFKPKTIYSNGQVFLKTIQLFGLKFSNIMRFTFLVSLLYIVAIASISFNATIASFELLDIDFGEIVVRVLSSDINKFIEMYTNLGLLFNPNSSFVLYFISSFWMAGLAYYAMFIFSKSVPDSKFITRNGIRNALICSFVLNSFLLTEMGLFTFLYILLSPLCIITMVKFSFKQNSANAVSQFFSYLSTTPGKTLGILFLFILIGFIGMVFIISPFAYFAIWLMEINVELSEYYYNLSLKTLMMFAFILLMSFSIVFYVTQCIFLAFTLDEVSEAEGLKESIESIGQRKRVYGIETE